MERVALLVREKKGESSPSGCGELLSFDCPSRETEILPSPCPKTCHVRVVVLARVQFPGRDEGLFVHEEERPPRVENQR